MPLESEEKQRKPPGSDWGVAGSPPREPARASGHHEERDTVGGAGLDAWSACQKHTNRPALLREAAGAGPVTASRAASLAVSPWGSARALVPAECPASCPCPCPCGLGRVSASSRPSWLWMGRVWTLGVACWPNSRGSRVPSNQGDGPLPGQDVSQSVSLETLHPGPGGSEEHAPRAASCCVTPGGRLSPHLAGWWP